jgi:EGF domain/Calcium-binding EGF domain/IPT/TIG domain
MRILCQIFGLVMLPLLLISCGDDVNGSPRAVDECAAGTDNCSSDASCSDTESSFSCSCNAGFSGDGTTSGTGCSNIDECASGADDCVDTTASCGNTNGSFTCTCVAGYRGDGKVNGSGCADVDECAGANPCGSAAICVNTVGAYQCRGLFAPSAFSNHVYRLDPTTYAVLQTIDPVLEGVVVTGAPSFAEDPSDRTVYAVIKVDNARRLARFDALAQTYTEVAPLADRFASIAIDAGGQLYGVTGNGATVPETLYQINKSTGEATLVRALGAGSDGEVIQFNPDDGQLYHWSGSTSFFEKIAMDADHTITSLSATYNREVFGARWDAVARDFVVFDINSGARRFAVDGTFTATDLAQFPDDLRSPATSVAGPHTLDPSSGDAMGGTAVTLVGSGFLLLGDSTTVLFGSDSAVGTVVDDTHITVTTPVAANGAGVVDVSISSGAYRFGWPQAFTYTAALPAARPR